MNHSFKKFLALVLTAATIFSLSAVAASSVFGADAATSTGKTPIAAFDFKKDLNDHSGRTDVGPVVIDEEPDGRSDPERLASTSHSGRAEWIEGTGIKVANGFFKLPENIFSGTDVSKIDGFTVSFTLTKENNPYNIQQETLFSFAEKDYFADKANTDGLPLGQRSDASVHMIYHGCIGSGEHPFFNSDGSGCWIDGALDGWGHESPILTYGTPHNVTVTYNTESNVLVLYVDGIFVQTSLNSDWEVLADLSNEDIHNLTSLVMGRCNDGFQGWWGFGTYSDVTIYSTALNAQEVSALVNGGCEAVAKCTAPVLEKDAPVLDGKGDGTFTAAAFNVDGLPVQLSVDFMGFPIPIDLNKGGPGADGTTKLSEAIAAKGWDILAVSENFTYNDELKSALSDNYNEEYNNEEDVTETVDLESRFDTSSGDTAVYIPFKTDGLSLFYKNTLTAKQESATPWNTHYSPDKQATGSFYLPMQNGADGLITKGFRRFTVKLAEDLTVDVYTLHMDADDAIGDKNARAEQLKQLAKFIVDTKTKNPIIIMGDTNCRYTRDDVVGNLIGTLNATDNLYARDAWVDTTKGGTYPEFASKTLNDEIVDKIIYVNNTECNYQLCLTKYEEVDFTAEDGSALSDHPAVVGTFAYAKKYSVTYNDGVDGKAFKSQTINTLSTNTTPTFNGTPTREGYTFKGWSPALTETVNGNATYTATWEIASASDDPGTTPGGQTTPPTTGDTANVVALFTVLAISGIGVTATVRSKKKDR